MNSIDNPKGRGRKKSISSENVCETFFRRQFDLVFALISPTEFSPSLCGNENVLVIITLGGVWFALRL